MGGLAPIPAPSRRNRPRWIDLYAELFGSGRPSLPRSGLVAPSEGAVGRVLQDTWRKREFPLRSLCLCSLIGSFLEELTEDVASSGDLTPLAAKPSGRRYLSPSGDAGRGEKSKGPFYEIRPQCWAEEGGRAGDFSALLLARALLFYLRQA